MVRSVTAEDPDASFQDPEERFPFLVLTEDHLAILKFSFCHDCPPVISVPVSVILLTFL